MSHLEKAIIYSPYLAEIRPLLKELDIEEIPRQRDSNPPFVITYGGDGSFLTAEQEWPEVPKIVLRRSRVCNTCREAVPRKALESLVCKKHDIRTFPKIVFNMGLTQGIATYDVVLRNWHPNQALRFCLENVSGGKVPDGEIIGDGLVMATPIGAGGYYRSITEGEFQSNFGLAFNNPTQPMEPISLADNFSVTVRILRENAFLCLDNLPSFWVLRVGDIFSVTKHPKVTRLVDILEFYCGNCRKELRF